MLALSVIFLISCGNTRTEQIILPEFNIPQISEDILVSRLSGHYVSDASSKEENQKNEIINLAIDRKWDLDRTESGILFRIESPGQPLKGRWGDKVKVHYQGYFVDLEKFDSSIDRKKALQFYVGNMIPGWNEALTMLGEGGHGIFLIPAYLAYGEDGFQDIVEPDQHLIFQIKLLEIIEKSNDQ